MLQEKETQTLEDADNLEMVDSSKEIIQLASQNKLLRWHGAIGWMVSASVVGGVSEIHVSFAGKKCDGMECLVELMLVVRCLE